MKKTHVKRSDYRKSTWSGGVTEELFLSPAEGRYEIGKFDFRVSTASIERETTEFTPLVGYQRQIMSLDKPLKLIHQTSQGTDIISLPPLTAHYFLGENQTTSVGVCNDFNLIYRLGLVGELHVCFQGENVSILAKQTCLIYCLEEMSVRMYHRDKLVETQHLETGNSLVLDNTFVSCDLIVFEKKDTTRAIAVVASVTIN